MLVDNGRISMQETFKTLGLTEKDIQEAKALHKKAIEIDKRLIGGDIDKKMYVNGRRKVNRTRKIKGGSEIGIVLKLSGSVVSYLYLSQVHFLYQAVFFIAWPKIVDVLDKYIDGTILDDTILTTVCNYIAYLLPIKLIEYFINVAKNDATVLAADLAKKTADIANANLVIENLLTTSPNPDFKIETSPNPDFYNNYFNANAPAGAIESKSLSGPEVKGMFMHLYYLARTSVVNNPFTTVGTVLTVSILAFMGYYLKIRISGSKDKNLDLDKTLYMNHNRRILIMRAQIRKAKKQERARIRENKEYDLKLMEQIADNMRGKKEEVVESKKKKRHWHKFVKRGFDENALYQQGDFLTDTRKRGLSGTRKKSPPKEDENAEDHDIDEIKS